MPALQVKECPDELYEQLRECAAKECRSMSQQTVYILKEYLTAYTRLQNEREGAFRAPNLIYVDPPRGLAETAQERERRLREEAEQEARRARKKEVIARIRAQPVTPLPPDCPDAAEIIRQGREERTDRIMEALEG